MLGIIILVVLGGVLGYMYYDYSKEEVVELESLEDINLEGKDLNNPNDLNNILEEAKPKLNELGYGDGRVNPRLKIFYQGEEVAYMDHNGNIGGVGNMTINDTDSGYGFFTYLGSKALHITTGWFDYVNATEVNSSKFCNGGNCYTLGDLNTTNTYTVYGDVFINETGQEELDGNLTITGNLTVQGNVTVEGVYFEGDVGNHNITDNATCIIINGDTSTINIC